MDPGHKAINLAIVVNAGTLVAFVVNPLVGAISESRYLVGAASAFSCDYT